MSKNNRPSYIPNISYENFVEKGGICMKKVLIGLLLGLSVGVVAGKMLTHVEVAEENEKNVEESGEITLQRRKIL